MQLGAGLVRFGYAGRRDGVVRRAAADYVSGAKEGGASGEYCFGDVEERYETGDRIGASSRQ